MKCPFCNAELTKVIDSRHCDDNSIRRRRQCETCGRRFTTYEKLETLPLTVIKKDNNRELYDREKIISGMLRACHKRPVSRKQIVEVVDQIENELFSLETQEISSKVIGELVMKKLNDLDSVAYVRFASVYRDFTDISKFVDEITKISNTKSE